MREQGQVIYGDEFCMLVNSVFETNTPSVGIHPNPTTGIIHFPDKVTYEIFDATGKMIRSGRSNTADITGNPSGLYFLRTLHEDHWSHHKVILEK